MAEVVVGGTVATDEIVADEKVIDMDNKMRLLDPDQTQFTTMTSRMGSRSATREKVNWLEESYVLDVYTASAYTSGATSVTITAAAESRAIQPNDVLRNMRTGQAMIVDVVVPGTGVLTVRPQGTNAAGNAGDKLLYVGTAYPQGANIGQPKYSARVLGFNYTQIFREPWNFAGTTTAIELYGGGEPAKEAARKAVEFKRQIEHNGFFGSRFFLTSVASDPSPQGGAGGLIEFIATNKQNVGGELTSDFLDLFLATVLSKGSSDKVIFTGTVGAYYISRFHRSGQGAFWKPSNENVHGVKVDGFISGVFGYQLPVVVKKEWANYPSGANGYNGNLFVVDMSNIERRPLRDRDTKLLTNRQGPGEDRVAAEYLAEISWEIAQERTHGLLTGIA